MRFALRVLAASLALQCSFAAADDADSLALRAGQAQERGEYREAARLLEEALSSRPRDYWLRTQLAEDYARMGRLPDAKREWAAARALDGEEKDAYVQEGYARLEAGDLREAEKPFLAAIAADAASPVGYRHMAFFYYKKADLGRSESYFRQALRRARETTRSDREEASIIMTGLGEVLLEEGRGADAEAIWRRGLERFSDIPRSRTTFLQCLGRASLRQGRFGRAEELLGRAAAGCDKSANCLGVLCDLAVAYAREGRARKAADAARRARSLYPLLRREPPFELDGYAGALLGMGDALRDSGDEVEAEKDYRLVAALRPAISGSAELADAEQALARLCASTGRKAEARGLLEDALAIARKQGDGRRESAVLGDLRSLEP